MAETNTGMYQGRKTLLAIEHALYAATNLLLALYSSIVTYEFLDTYNTKSLGNMQDVFKQPYLNIAQYTLFAIALPAAALLTLRAFQFESGSNNPIRLRTCAKNPVDSTPRSHTAISVLSNAALMIASAAFYNAEHDNLHRLLPVTFGAFLLYAGLRVVGAFHHSTRYKTTTKCILKEFDEGQAAGTSKTGNFTGTVALEGMAALAFTTSTFLNLVTSLALASSSVNAEKKQSSLLILLFIFQGLSGALLAVASIPRIRNAINIFKHQHKDSCKSLLPEDRQGAVGGARSRLELGGVVRTNNPVAGLDGPRT